MTKAFKQGFQDMMQKIAIQHHDSYSPIGALTYGGLGAVLGALIDKKKRKRGALIGGLLGALGGTATDVGSYVYSRKEKPGEAGRDGARAAELDYMAQDLERWGVDSGRLAGRDLAWKGRDHLFSPKELADNNRKAGLDLALQDRQMIDRERAHSDELKARAAYNSKGLGKRLNPRYTDEFDAAYKVKMDELKAQEAAAKEREAIVDEEYEDHVYTPSQPLAFLR